MDFFDAFTFLKNHPAFDGDLLCGGLDIAVAKVNPKTKRIEDTIDPKTGSLIEDREGNTETRIWLETGLKCGSIRGQPMWGHDIDLDCGGATFEEAIVTLALKVREKYGDYARRLPYGKVYDPDYRVRIWRYPAEPMRIPFFMIRSGDLIIDDFGIYRFPAASFAQYRDGYGCCVRDPEGIWHNSGEFGAKLIDDI